MKCVICMSLHINVLCLICINHQCLQNCIEFDNDAWVLLDFHSKYSKTRTISNTYVQTKFNMITLSLVTIVNVFGSWSVIWFSVSWLSWAQESIRTCVWNSVAITICCNAPQRTRTRFTAGNSPYLEQRLRVLAGWSACAPYLISKTARFLAHLYVHIYV